MAVMTCWAHSLSSSVSSVPASLSLVLLLLSLSLSLQASGVSGSYEHTCTLDTRSRGAHPHGICGKSLARVVSVLCQPRGYVSNVYKRSAPSRPRRDEGFVNEKLRGVLLNKKEALSYLGKKRDRHSIERQPRAINGRSSFGSQGITCECCYNRCDIYELLQYCN